MSGFNNYEKDCVYEGIEDFIKGRRDEGVKPGEIMKELMEVISYGIERGFYEEETKQ